MRAIAELFFTDVSSVVIKPLERKDGDKTFWRTVLITQTGGGTLELTLHAKSADALKPKGARHG